ncbi:Hypothetical protein PHPALM_14452 [Phytophthora palmivora]|uniref:PiggyBac transposable element-derived protein domain-containing protein n=1 Tax=Phytophthora palmivora TaxID=4796 RepID=A0A2P4XUP2_9STRA|nr:Hypothetical protein PHPALM_14452 [Phytophthora palmivora]
MVLNNMLKKCASLAVSNGVSALDESSIRTKARSAIRTYIPSKPDKYTVRFYALVDGKTLYVHDLFGNGSGNSTVSGHLERYTAVFPELRRRNECDCIVGCYVDQAESIAPFSKWKTSCCYGFVLHKTFIC